MTFRVLMMTGFSPRGIKRIGVGAVSAAIGSAPKPCAGGWTGDFVVKTAVARAKPLIIKSALKYRSR